MPQTTPAKRDDRAARFSFPALRGKKVTAAFDGGRVTSGGRVLLGQAQRTMAICGQLAGCVADPRDPSRVVHRLEDILRARVLPRFSHVKILRRTTILGLTWNSAKCVP